MSNLKEYTVAVYCYMLSLGEMGKGDFLCVNQEQHGEFKSFDTEGEMRSHWAECHKISLEEVFLMLVVPDSGTEPPMVVNMPMLDMPGVSGVQVNPPKAKGAGKGIGKGTGKDTGNRKARGRASKLPPSCFSAITKLAAAPAVRPTEVNTDKPQNDPLELDQWEKFSHPLILYFLDN